MEIEHLATETVEGKRIDLGNKHIEVFHVQAWQRS